MAQQGRVLGENLPPPTENRGPMLIQITWIMAGIATPFVVARVCARLKHLKELRLDDYLMILSLVFAVIAGGLTIEQVRAGFGQHIYYLPPEDFTYSVKLSYISLPLRTMSLVFGRVSFAVSLIVLTGTVKWRRWLLYSIIASQFVVNLTFIGVGFGVCTPARKFWDRKTPGTCLNPSVRKNLAYVQGGLNIFVDLVLALMPAIVISNLNLNKKVKFGLVFLMSLGVFNMIAAIITVVELARAGTALDLTYTFVVVDIWTLIQIYLVIVIASIPFLRPLFIGNKVFSWAYYRSWITRCSRRSRSTSGQDRGDSCELGNTGYEKVGAATFGSARPMPKARLYVTRLQRTGTETGLDELSYVEAGRGTSDR